MVDLFGLDPTPTAQETTTNASTPATSPAIETLNSQFEALFDAYGVAAIIGILLAALIILYLWQSFLCWILSLFFAVSPTLVDSLKYVGSLILLHAAVMACTIGIAFVLGSITPTLDSEQQAILGLAIVSVQILVSIGLFLFAYIGLPMNFYRMSFTEASGFCIGMFTLGIAQAWILFIVLAGPNLGEMARSFQPAPIIAPHSTTEPLTLSGQGGWESGQRVFLSEPFTVNVGYGDIELREGAALTIVKRIDSSTYQAKWKDNEFPIAARKLRQ